MLHYDLEWLKSSLQKGESHKYLSFWGHTPKMGEETGKFVFSQWYRSPFVVDGITFTTTEHWMMAQKALLFNDKEVYEKILLADKPGEAKELGRQVANFEEETWVANRYSIVKEGNWHKFSQNPVLKDYLLATGNRVLVEASPVDRIWGVGLAVDKPQIENPFAWRGLNLLGFALMEVRDGLRGL